ncbi:myeloid-associated differentiation marker homolog [Corythoichthys intestinalis]|uniref:myeloid-associated differentiation marker homolog n=1 Tax=Corythoichthys intestinalis TaxID=161448 RepID=UPI0025A68F51|nr:myeloid-associated differentiation marker homolog [Corythoichthys intestinalis]XP_061811014.1 myeloid-associated differentiation marker homolog [Nerophis lumbriciformis]
MPVIALGWSRLLCARVVALLFTCVAFSVAAHGARLPPGGMASWCIFCWAFSFAATALILLVELLGLQARVPVSWSNFPITVACYAALLCLSASVIFPLNFLRDSVYYDEAREHRVASTVFSCLAAVAYMVEVCLTKARPGEVAGYMATVPGLLKVCQTFVACVIFILVSEPVAYESHAALQWCMAVYCICFILSIAVVVMCVGECTGYLPLPFPRFLSAFGLLAVAMYLTATILWPVFQFSKRYGGRGAESSLIAVAVLTGLNFLLYLADLAHTARLVFVSM